MRGLGVDLVSLPEFAAQVGAPGSTFLTGVLTPREARRVRSRAAATSGARDGSARYHEAVARHAGGLWAAKEAFIKAWETSLGAASSWRVLVSISHDGPCAIAHVVIADASTSVPRDDRVTP